MSEITITIIEKGNSKEIIKNLIENTREVLFEKSQRYYYKCYGKQCLDECMINHGTVLNVMIGSYCCYSECIYNRDGKYNDEDYNDENMTNYVLCKKIREATLKQ